MAKVNSVKCGCWLSGLLKHLDSINLWNYSVLMMCLFWTPPTPHHTTLSHLFESTVNSMVLEKLVSIASPSGQVTPVETNVLGWLCPPTPNEDSCSISHLYLRKCDLLTNHLKHIAILTKTKQKQPFRSSPFSFTQSLAIGVALSYNTLCEDTDQTTHWLINSIVARPLTLPFPLHLQRQSIKRDISD